MKRLIKYEAILLLMIISISTTHMLNKSTLSSLSRNKIQSENKNMYKTNTHMLMSLELSFMDLNNYSIEERMGGYPPVSLDNTQPSVGGVCYSGWEKYTKADSFADKNFISNPQKNGDKFYFVVTDKIISVFYNEAVDKTYDSIILNNLDPVRLGETLSGGVSDVGNFKEGFCYSLKGERNQQEFKWVVCSENYVRL